MKVEYFRSLKRTNRFNEKQKVWISHNFPNHLYIWFKWRGKGRYVRGVIDKFEKYIGEIKEIDVDDNFANRIKGPLS